MTDKDDKPDKKGEDDSKPVSAEESVEKEIQEALENEDEKDRLTRETYNAITEHDGQFAALAHHIKKNQKLSESKEQLETELSQKKQTMSDLEERFDNLESRLEEIVSSGSDEDEGGQEEDEGSGISVEDATSAIADELGYDSVEDLENDLSEKETLEQKVAESERRETMRTVAETTGFDKDGIQLVAKNRDIDFEVREDDGEKSIFVVDGDEEQEFNEDYIENLTKAERSALSASDDDDEEIEWPQQSASGKSTQVEQGSIGKSVLDKRYGRNRTAASGS